MLALELSEVSGPLSVADVEHVEVPADFGCDNNINGVFRLKQPDDSRFGATRHGVNLTGQGRHAEPLRNWLTFMRFSTA